MKKLFLPIFLAILLISAGCTSAPKEENKDSTLAEETTLADIEKTIATSPEVEQTEAEQTTIPYQEETTTTQAKPPEETGSDLKDQIKSLFSNAAMQYTVAYDTKLSGPDQPDYESKVSYYIKGAEKMRIDTLSNLPGGGESRFYILGADYIMCNKQTGAWACLKIPRPDATSNDPKKQVEDLKKNIETSRITALPDRVIAGVKAKCYKMTLLVGGDASASTYDSTYCLSAEGVILYSDTTSDNVRMVMEATSYKTSVEDSDLVPPAEPKSLSFT